MPVKVREKPDRRGPDRLRTAPCRACGSPQTRVSVRLDYALYVACTACGLVFGLPLPEKHWKRRA